MGVFANQYALVAEVGRHWCSHRASLAGEGGCTVAFRN